MFRYRLGYRYKDFVTGIEGVATSRVEYLNGCRQYGIETEVKEGATDVPLFYFDEGRIAPVMNDNQMLADFVEKEFLPQPEEEAVAGGPPPSVKPPRF